MYKTCNENNELSFVIDNIIMMFSSAPLNYFKQKSPPFKFIF